MKSNFIKTIKNKRVMYLILIAFLLLFTVALNLTFSAFTNRSENAVANIKVKEMAYNIAIDGVSKTTMTIAGDKTTTANIIISSLNSVDSKYELTYKVCSTLACTSFIEKPDSLTIEYSSRTIDSISGSIITNGYKQIRIAVTNTSTITYYIKLDKNAGYIHNTLALQNLITSEYNEEDVKIAAIIDGEVSTTFPSIKGDYEATVSCTKNGGATNATGTATWNGTKWVVNITGVDTGQTVCNVNFYVPLKNLILAQGGGTTAIEAKGSATFTKMALSQTTYDSLPDTGYPSKNNSVVENGLYASADEYGTSYYYRGERNIFNNNLIFGGFQWKIIRINGDGSIRIIYNGTEAQFNINGTMNTTGDNTQIGSYAWNTTNGNDAKYVGYMYGGANGVASTSRNGTVSTAATYNQTNSNVKTVLDNWYQTNISGKAFESKIADNLFCNDRQLQSEV